jgi:hypothetical protein
MRERFAIRTLIAELAITILAGIPMPLFAQTQTQPAVAALPPAWVLPPAAQPQPAQTIAIRAGRLFDPKSGALLTNQVVVVRGERIEDVGSAVQIPPSKRLSRL